MKLLEGKVRKVLKDTGKGRDFLKKLSRSWQMGLMKLKGFYTSEEVLQWEKIFAAMYLTEVSRLPKELKRPPNQGTKQSTQ